MGFTMWLVGCAILMLGQRDLQLPMEIKAASRAAITEAVGETLPSILGSHLGAAVEAATKPVLGRSQESFDKHFAEMVPKFQSVNGKISTHGITIHDLVKRLGHLEK
ncbi:unnamed protein product, partial [Prorocentrum cordatum]